MSAGYLKKCSSGGRPKKVFATRGAAEAHREWMIARGAWKRATSNVYACMNHGAPVWHSGSTGHSNRGGGTRRVKRAPRLDCQ